MILNKIINIEWTQGHITSNLENLGWKIEHSNTFMMKLVQ